MKKCSLFVILFFTFLTFILPIKAEVIRNYGDSKIYKTVFFKSGELDANKILFKYVKEYYSGIEHTKYFVLSSVKAYNVDLNDDGIKEIVGIIVTPDYCSSGAHGCSLFILCKKNKTYKNISQHGIAWQYGLKIANKKTNNFHNLILTPDIGKHIEIRYDLHNGEYSYR